MKLTNEEKLTAIKDLEEKIINVFKEDYKIETNYINKTKVLEDKMKTKKSKMDYFDNITNEILPYDIDKMNKENIQFLLTKYSLISLLDNNKSKNDDEYHITSTLVVNLAIEDKTKEEAISYVVDKINMLFNQINIPILISEQDNINEQYEKIFIIRVKNNKNKVKSICEISIISKNFLNDLGLSKQMQDKIIINISFNEQIFEYYKQYN